MATVVSAKCLSAVVHAGAATCTVCVCVYVHIYHIYIYKQIFCICICIYIYIQLQALSLSIYIQIFADTFVVVRGVAGWFMSLGVSHNLPGLEIEEPHLSVLGTYLKGPCTHTAYTLALMQSLFCVLWGPSIRYMSTWTLRVSWSAAADCSDMLLLGACINPANRDPPNRNPSTLKPNALNLLFRARYCDPNIRQNSGRGFKFRHRFDPKSSSRVHGCEQSSKQSYYHFRRPSSKPICVFNPPLNFL